MQDRTLLTDDERVLLKRRETLRHGAHGKPWRDHVIEIDWLPLVFVTNHAHLHRKT